MPSLRAYWYRAWSSLWLLPATICAAAIGLAFALVTADLRAPIHLSALLGLPGPGAGADGARAVLAAIATSVVSVAGVAFSVTVVTLALAASQYSSRVLRAYLRDRVTQVALGLLVGTFAYCLLVLRTVDDAGGDPFVPTLAVFGGVVLAFVSIGAFVFFVHHVAVSIQASHILASVARETLHAVDRLFPDTLGEGSGEDAAPRPDDLPQAWQPIAAVRSGYVQQVDESALLRFAREHRTIVRMERAIGEFVAEGMPLAAVPARLQLSEPMRQQLRRCYDIDRLRTVVQDAAFGLQQLVDVALKALSPGINDTTTAITCVDWLLAIMLRVAGRRLPSDVRREDGEIRVLARGATFRGLADLAFAQIRQHAGGNSAVLLRQLESIETLLAHTADGGRREVIRGHAEQLIDAARRRIPTPADREPIERIAARLALAGPAAAGASRLGAGPAGALE
jgi:uncharacterized membrane protein